MTTLTAPAGVVPLSAPLPATRKYTLLDAAREAVQDNSRWLAGITSEGYVPGPGSVFDHCAGGTDRIKDGANPISLTKFGAFTVYLVGSCTSVSIGSDSSFWEDRLRLAFEAIEAEVVERVFATGEGNAAFGPHLNDANLKTLDASGVGVVDGIGMLEDEIAAIGGGGMIHVTPYLANLMAANNLIDLDRAGQKVTRGNGTRVAIGAGYIGAAASSGDGEVWAYATGPVEFTRDQTPTIIPTDYSQALDRSNNDVLFIAEREYVLNWVGRSDPSDDHHIQAGVLIDRAP